MWNETWSNYLAVLDGRYLIDVTDVDLRPPYPGTLVGRQRREGRLVMHYGCGRDYGWCTRPQSRTDGDSDRDLVPLRADPSGVRGKKDRDTTHLSLGSFSDQDSREPHDINLMRPFRV